jgi:hypothetical protein
LTGVGSVPSPVTFIGSADVSVRGDSSDGQECPSSVAGAWLAAFSRSMREPTGSWFAPPELPHACISPFVSVPKRGNLE